MTFLMRNIILSSADLGRHILASLDARPCKSYCLALTALVIADACVVSTGISETTHMPGVVRV